MTDSNDGRRQCSYQPISSHWSPRTFARRGELKLSQIGEQRRESLGHERSIDVHTVGRENWWHDTWRSNHLCAFEYFRVVIHDLFKRRGAVVVEIRCCVSNAAKSGDIELVPVV